MTTPIGGTTNDFNIDGDQRRNESRNETSLEPLDLELSNPANSTQGQPDSGMEQSRQRPEVINGFTENPDPGNSGVRLEHYSYSRSGPLPDVGEFAGYEQVLPGAAHRILTMAEKALDAEIYDQKTTTRAESTAFVGAALGVSYLPWFLFATAAFLAVKGLDIAALVAVLSGVVTSGPQIINASKRLKPQPRPAPTPPPAPTPAPPRAQPKKQQGKKVKKRQ